MANSFITDRYHRLRNLKAVQPGNVWMAKCRCGHLAPLPVATLIKKHGESFRIDAAMSQVRCTACGRIREAKAKLFPLCELGCGRHLGVTCD